MQPDQNAFGQLMAFTQCDGQLSLSEVMTILVYFHQVRFRDFKTYYTHYVDGHLRGEFPQLVSYNRLSKFDVTVSNKQPESFAPAIEIAVYLVQVLPGLNPQGLSIRRAIMPIKK